MLSLIRSVIKAATSLSQWRGGREGGKHFGGGSVMQPGALAVKKGKRACFWLRSNASFLLRSPLSEAALLCNCATSF